MLIRIMSIIGAIISACVIISIPVLLGLSFGFNWPWEAKFAFTIFTVLELLVLCTFEITYVCDNTDI